MNKKKKIKKLKKKLAFSKTIFELQQSTAEMLGGAMKDVLEIISDTPNDTDLGKKVREYFSIPPDNLQLKVEMFGDKKS